VDPVRANLSSRERIIKAARKAFAERGHDGVSMSEIAQMASVKKALIYYYFPVKRTCFTKSGNTRSTNLKIMSFRKQEMRVSTFRS